MEDEEGSDRVEIDKIILINIKRDSYVFLASLDYCFLHSINDILNIGFIEFTSASVSPDALVSLTVYSPLAINAIIIPTSKISTPKGGIKKKPSIPQIQSIIAEL